MAQNQKKVHIVAEVAALIAAVILLFLPLEIPILERILIKLIAGGTILVDLVFLFSWFHSSRTKRLVFFHISTEVLGIISGCVLIYLSCGIENHLKYLYVLIMGATVFMIDTWFLTTWFVRKPDKVFSINKASLAALRKLRWMAVNVQVNRR